MALRMLEAPALSPAQCRAGRALLGWRQADLAEKSGVSARLIMQYEGEQVDPKPVTLWALRMALEGAGVLLGPNEGVSLAPRGYASRQAS